MTTPEKAGDVRRIIFMSSVALLLGAMPFGWASAATSALTKTPIGHVIVLFQENISFDHYFGTYPRAANLAGEPAFHALPGTPSVNGLTDALLTANPNKSNPARLSPKQAATCDMDHGYTPEQMAFDGGLMDKFVEYTSAAVSDNACDPNVVMDYFDGNTVTALWHYAQHFALNDNSFGTTFGPSSPGAINLVSGNTHGATPADLKKGDEVITVQGTMIGDPDPQYDDCSNPKAGLVAMTGRNIGDLLNDKHVTWGWFQGGFRPTAMTDGKAACGAKSTNLLGKEVADYSPHHEPFEYYQQSANPHHLPPSSPAMIGESDQANHQYDLSDFYDALASGHLPAVSFVKAKKYQDGHAGFAYSNPLDEQTYLAAIVNAIERSRYWKDAAIIIAYDDSDGWYDHVMPPILTGSAVAGIDALNGPGKCGNAKPDAYAARCGYGPRLPLLVVSSYARTNAVDHTLTDQSSIIRFIEDNWQLGRIGDQSTDALAGPLDGMFDFRQRRAEALLLNPKTGEVTH
jgi:phospholipase C